MKVTLFVPCFVDLCYPKVAMSMVMLLERLGHEVVFHESITCCGQPAFNSGFDREARRVARRTLRAIGSGEQPIVVPSGSCAAMMRLHWRELFHGDRDAELARSVSTRVVEWSAFLAGRIDALEAAGPRWHGRVAYHESCHMLRELRIAAQPRALLAAVDGLELVDLRSSDRCCGFGGTFSVRYPDVSVAMADSKLSEVDGAGVDALVSADGGCLMHLGGRMSRTGSAVRPLHLATLLAEALVR